MLKPDLAEKLRVLVNIHGPIAPKTRPAPLSMPLGLQPGNTSPVSELARSSSSHLELPSAYIWNGST